MEFQSPIHMNTLDGLSLKSGENTYIGCAIDIIRRQGPNALKGSLLTKQAYADEIIDVMPTENAGVISVESDSLLETFSSLTVEAGLSTGKAVPFFSGNISAKYGEKRKLESAARFYSSNVFVETQKHSISPAYAAEEDLLEYLPPNVIAHINDTQKYSPQKIFDTWGTHLITEASIGGSIQVTAIYNSTQSIKSHDLKVAVDFSCMYVSGHASTELTDEQKNALKETEIRAFCNGGNSSLLAGLVSISDFTRLLKEWGQSLNDPKKHVLAQIVRCVPIWTFAETSARQEELEAHFYKLAAASGADIANYFTKEEFEVITLSSHDWGQPKRLTGATKEKVQSLFKFSDSKYTDMLEGFAIETGGLLPEHRIQMIHNKDNTCSFRFTHNNKYLQVSPCSTDYRTSFRENGQLFVSGNAGDTTGRTKFIVEPYGDSTPAVKIKSVFTGEYVRHALVAVAGSQDMGRTLGAKTLPSYFQQEAEPTKFTITKL